MPLYLALQLTCVYLNICRVCKSFFLMYVFLLRLAKGGGGSIEMVNGRYLFSWIGSYFPIGLARGFPCDDPG